MTCAKCKTAGLISTCIGFKHVRNLSCCFMICTKRWIGLLIIQFVPAYKEDFCFLLKVITIGLQTNSSSHTVSTFVRFIVHVDCVVTTFGMNVHILTSIPNEKNNDLLFHRQNLFSMYEMIF